VDAFLVVLYTSPRRIVDLMPVTALLGGLMGLGAMANHQELIAARAAGLSKSRMAKPVFQATLLLAVAVVLMQTIVVPQSERTASSLRSKALEATSVEDTTRLNFWTRSGNNFVHVGDVRFNQVLEDVEIFQTSEQGKLKVYYQAAQATITGADTWLLEDVTRTELAGMSAAMETMDRLQWEDLLTREQANILILPLEALAPHELVLYIRHLQDNELDTHHFRVVFWKQVSIAISVIAMGLLSLPLLVGSTRGISASQRILLGGILGIMFYLLQQLTGNLAGVLNLVPSITIMAPVFALLGISIAAQYWRGFRKPAPATASQEQS
jgi:lipopolysaccharide export system permease protein